MSSTLPPLDRFEGSLSRRVYHSLRQAILTLRLQPGAKLNKHDICAELGVSRSPVSEALARLSAEGLVRVVPQAGSFVSKLSMAEIRESAFLREALELAAVEELASRITDDELAALQRNLRMQATDVAHQDLEGFYQLDEAFHRLILGFTGHSRLAELTDMVCVHVTRARQLALPQPGRIQVSLEEHQAIVEALEARDPERARQSMRAHLRQLEKQLEPLERAHPELFEAG
jgi:DNA-binding GntR family transcriptional regulator